MIEVVDIELDAINNLDEDDFYFYQWWQRRWEWFTYSTRGRKELYKNGENGLPWHDSVILKKELHAV